MGEAAAQVHKKRALASGFIIILTFMATVTKSCYKSCVFTLPDSLVQEGYPSVFGEPGCDPTFGRQAVGNRWEAGTEARGPP